MTLTVALAPTAGGMTRICHLHQRAPLHIYRPIHLDPARPEMAFIFVLQAGDGFVLGDRCRIDVECAPGAAVHVTTQAATNIFAAPDHVATQHVDLHAGAGAVLEYMPEPTVPFRGSRFFQRIRLILDPEGTAIVAETLLPGRVAHGEAHAYDLYRSDIEAERPDGTLLFADTLRLSPACGDDPHSLALLGPHEVLATLYAVTARAEPRRIVAELREALATHSDIAGGASELPNQCGAAVRILGPTGKAVRAALRTAWNAARLAALGAPAPNLRKG